MGSSQPRVVSWARRVLCSFSRPGRFNLDLGNGKKSQCPAGRCDIPFIGLMSSGGGGAARKGPPAIYTSTEQGRRFAQMLPKGGRYPLPLRAHMDGCHYVIGAASFLTGTA